MGRRKKQKDNIIEHLNTTISIKEGRICTECPMKLYALNKYVSLGVGNIYSNIIFILPMYDFKADINYTTILSILQEQYKSITSKELLEEVYVTRAVKCFEYTPYDVFDDAINYCNTFLNYELSKIQSKHIVFFGDTYEKIFEGLKLHRNFIVNRYIHKIYNPAVMYYENDNLKQKFIEQLTEVIYYDTK